MILIFKIVYVYSLHVCLILASDIEIFEQDGVIDQACSIKDQVLEEDIDWALNDLSQDDPELVRIVKEKYLIKPSKRPINLTKPATVATLQGQFQQPIILDAEYYR